MQNKVPAEKPTRTRHAINGCSHSNKKKIFVVNDLILHSHLMKDTELSQNIGQHEVLLEKQLSEKISKKLIPVETCIIFIHLHEGTPNVKKQVNTLAMRQLNEKGFQNISRKNIEHHNHRQAVTIRAIKDLIIPKKIQARKVA